MCSEGYWYPLYRYGCGTELTDVSGSGVDVDDDVDAAAAAAAAAAASSSACLLQEYW